MWFVSLFIWGIIAYHVIYGLFLLIMNWRNSRILIGYQKSHQNNLYEPGVHNTVQQTRKSMQIVSIGRYDSHWNTGDVMQLFAAWKKVHKMPPLFF